MAREDGIWLQDWTTGDNLKINTDGSLNVQSTSQEAALNDAIFVLNVENTIGSAESPSVQIYNPAASGKKLNIQSISLSCIQGVSSEMTVRIYKTPTVTSNGSAVVAQPIRVGGALPTAGGLAYSNPTVSNNGTRIYTLYLIGGPGGTSTTFLNFQDNLIIDPGYRILLTGIADGTNRTLAANITWAEVVI